MQVTIEITNKNTLALLQQLEQLNLLRFVGEIKKNSTTPARKWAGSISKETGKKMQAHVEKSRNEWERNI